MSAVAAPRSNERAGNAVARSRAATLAAGALCAGLLLASRWSESIQGTPTQLTFGRVALLLVAAALTTAALLRGRPRWARPRRVSPRLPGNATLLAIALAGEAAVMLVSVTTRGQNSAGALYGSAEVALVALLTFGLLRLRPHLSTALLACAAGGAVAGCLLALATDDTTSALHGPSGRLTGYYGNPNFLGFAGALAVPILLTLALRAGGPRAVACRVALVGTAAAIALSYSRGAVIAAVAGVIAVISLSRSTVKRRLQAALAGSLTFAAVAAAGYPLYLHLRTHADFAPAARAGTPDRSGWDPRAQGLIPAGPSRLANTKRGALRVSAARRGAGASLPLGHLVAGRRYEIALTLSSAEVGLEVGAGLEDNLLGAGPATATGLLRPKPRTLLLRWTPSRDSANARLYVWLPRGGAATLSAADFGRIGRRKRALSLRLLGTADAYAGQLASESRYVHSREDAASLALRLFAEKPLTGVGWQRFTVYSAKDLHYGALATHDEYLRYAAELGLPGLFFLLLAIVALGRAALRTGLERDGVAAASCLAAGGVGLLFVNALEVPSIALPLAVSAAVLCADGRRLTSRAR